MCIALFALPGVSSCDATKSPWRNSCWGGCERSSKSRRPSARRPRRCWRAASASGWRRGAMHSSSLHRRTPRPTSSHGCSSRCRRPSSRRGSYSRLSSEQRCWRPRRPRYSESSKLRRVTRGSCSTQRARTPARLRTVRQSVCLRQCCVVSCLRMRAACLRTVVECALCILCGLGPQGWMSRSHMAESRRRSWRRYITLVACFLATHCFIHN